jgi:hypothetical protein
MLTKAFEEEDIFMRNHASMSVLFRISRLYLYSRLNIRKGQNDFNEK